MKELDQIFTDYWVPKFAQELELDAICTLSLSKVVGGTKTLAEHFKYMRELRGKNENILD